MLTNELIAPIENSKLVDKQLGTALVGESGYLLIRLFKEMA